MWDSSACGGNPFGDADAQVAREVLHLVLAERPLVPTVGEIELALAQDGSFAARDAVERGVDELIRAGVLRREGESILPTRWRWQTSMSLVRQIALSPGPDTARDLYLGGHGRPLRGFLRASEYRSRRARASGPRGRWGRSMPDPSSACGKLPGMSGKPQGLITSQARILAVMYLSPEVSFSEIASRLDLDQKTVREKIEALVKQGHVARTKRPGRPNRYEINKHTQITDDSAAAAYRLAELLAVNAYPPMRPPGDL